MRGPSFDELTKAASAHPVVVLVSNDKECQALLIRTADAPLTSIQLPGVNPSQLHVIVKTATTHRIVCDLKTDDCVDSDDDTPRAMRPPQLPLGGMLAMLWRSVVKPILDHLSIQVSISARIYLTSRLTTL
jgi:hypothetical protein